ncbi:putative holin-like toxin [Paenibacillus sp. DP01]
MTVYETLTLILSFVSLVILIIRK